jgi:hypothetical protein
VFNLSGAEIDRILGLSASQENVSKAVSIALGIVDALSGFGDDLSSWKSSVWHNLHSRRLLTTTAAATRDLAIDHRSYPSITASRRSDRSSSDDRSAGTVFNRSCPSSSITVVVVVVIIIIIIIFHCRRTNLMAPSASVGGRPSGDGDIIGDKSDPFFYNHFS